MPAPAPAPYDALSHLPIAGRWRDGSGGESRAVTNPYDGATLLEIVQADRADLDEAYAAAERAQAEWSAAVPAERAAVLRKAAGIMEARKDEIVGWLVREAGSTRVKAELEWVAAHAVTLEAASIPHRIAGRILPADIPGKEGRAYRRPVGVVAIVSPWNWPLQLTARSLMPALACGNACVVKPASDTPVTGGLLLARILEEAGLPPGLLSVVVGKGSEIGDAVVCHAVPRVVSFTGSTPVGRHLAALAAEAPILKRLELELGGNGAFVVLDDADLEAAVEAAVFGKFLHQGQICMITNRFIVEDGIHDRFVEAFTEAARQMTCGDPADPRTAIGPIINRKQLDSLTGRIAEADGSGARKVLGGAPQGQVLPPHVYTGVTNDMPLAQNELFGPIAPILRAADAEEAVRLANDTEYGLSAAVFTGDLDRGVRLAQRIRSGMVHVNDSPVNDLPNQPFGGEKNSGIGRFGGDWAIDAFTTDQWITVQHERRRFPFPPR